MKSVLALVLILSASSSFASATICANSDFSLEDVQVNGNTERVIARDSQANIVGEYIQADMKNDGAGMLVAIFKSKNGAGTISIREGDDNNHVKVSGEIAGDFSCKTASK